MCHHDPSLLSTIFPEPGESLMVGLQDSLYSVYNPQYQFVPDISSVTSCWSVATFLM